MSINEKRIGEQIAALRKAKGLTQKQLGERLSVSFQAVSKWERGDAMPDVGTLPDLARVLETSVDNILTGGEQVLRYCGKITVADMREGIRCFNNAGKLLGRGNIIYRYAIEGINERMNTDIEAAFSDSDVFECFVAEAIIQNLKAGFYIDLTDVKNGFQNEHFRDIVCNYAEKYGIK